LDIFLISVTVLIAVTATWTVLRPGDDDPNWELRWRGLDPDYRNWLAAMATNPAWMKTLTDPEEVRLAKGLARRERRHLAYYDLAAGVLVALTIALALAGVLPFSFAGLCLGVLAMIRWPIESWRRRQIRRKVQLGFEPGELPTPLTQTPP
jgi:hypothetical protein